MRFDVLTLFPDFFISPLEQSIIGKAIAKGLIEVHAHNIRDYARDKHRTTDDYPYGGGHGMVMKAEPVTLALEAVKGDGSGKVILTTPQGTPFNHALATTLSREDRVIIICGRYEGFDERIRVLADIEVSIGDYVLTGGEIPALVIMDAVGRLVPGVLGEPESAVSESFAGGLLEYPQYTRPEEFRGNKVPEVLLSGNHAEIERWRRAESIKRTYLKRPDLLTNEGFSEDDRKIIEELKKSGK